MRGSCEPSWLAAGAKAAKLSQRARPTDVLGRIGGGVESRMDALDTRALSDIGLYKVPRSCGENDDAGFEGLTCIGVELGEISSLIGATFAH